MSELLFELYVEELPASYLDRVIDALPQTLSTRLSDLRVVAQGERPQVRVTGTPRRIVAHVAGLLAEQRGLEEELLGPPASAAFKDGKPTKAAEAFAAKVGVPVDRVQQRETPKGKYLVGTKRAESRPLAQVLPRLLEDVLQGIEFPKSMTWVPGSKLRFARPLRGIVALLGAEVVPLEWNGVRSGRTTYGHPFLSPGKIEVASASWPDYEMALRGRKVVVSRDERRERITRLVKAHLPGANVPQASVVATSANLVEWPEVMVGQFERRFLEIPPGVIAAAVQGHLRAFPIFDASGKLTNEFAFVCNRPGNPTIRAGNERVLRARLSDAHFFYAKDQKTPLEQLAPRLKDTVFQERLGSYWDKQERVANLALDLAQKNGWAIEASIARAASLMKAGRVAQVGGELPELQGEIGSDYAHRQGLPHEVAEAIREAYQPRNEGDVLPRTRTGIALSIAEKLDNAVSAFATNMKPTGSRDPLGVRRQLLGVLRILRDNDLGQSLLALIEAAARNLPDAAVTPRRAKDPKAPPPDLAAIRTALAKDVHDYARGRLQALAQDEGFGVELVKAVLATGSDSVPDFWARIRALGELAGSERFAALASLVERTRNITRDKPAGTPRPDLAREPAERDLFEALEGARGGIESALAARRYVEAGQIYERSFSSTVERFMKEVYVQDKDAAIAQNRISLLRTIYRLLADGFADLAEVSAGKSTS